MWQFNTLNSSERFVKEVTNAACTSVGTNLVAPLTSSGCILCCKREMLFIYIRKKKLNTKNAIAI